MIVDMFEQRYNKLNEQQRVAVDTLDGPVIVIAGPGSGKTELLSVRVANILRSKDVLASNILCLTFTEAAAANMRKRLVSLIGSEAYRVAIHTFHSFGTDIINRFPEYFYHGAVFRPADELVQIELLEQILLQLPYNDPLSGKHQDTFTYLPSIRSSISDLKKAGLTPEAFSEILDANDQFLTSVYDEVASVFGGTVTKATAEQAAGFVNRWLALAPEVSEGLLLGQQSSLAAVLTESLAKAVNDVLATGKTTSLTLWKKRHITKDDHDRAVLKEHLYAAKMRSLQHVYQLYRQQMHEQRYFDYDDMLLDVLQALEGQPQLRYAVQEQYQYVLVDEFQDTNDAQMRLLGLLTDAPVHEGRPNMMVVGDDDQAIYKFQGANVANIQQFRRRFEDPSQIVLNKNYRSTRHILDVARQVIVLGESRMEDEYADVVKELEAAGDIPDGAVEYSRYATRAHEFAQVAEKIKQALADGQPAEDIAVITRWHRDLEEFAAYLQQAGVPVRYERQRDVLRQPHIQQLVQMARFVWLLARHQQAEADELLPEILSYPFWQIDRKVIWQLSVTANHASVPAERLWLHQMDVSADPFLQAMATWWRELRGLAETESLEKMLEYLLGAHTPLLVADDNGENGAGPSPKPLDGFVSPFKEYYFDQLRHQQERDRYISFLSSLQVFVRALREYKPDQELRLADMLQFVQMRQANHLPIVDVTPYVSGEHAVQLLSAHKAKGLEFGTVFLILCQENVWQGRGRGDILPFPANLPLSSEADDREDNLRIFYVALTRAKHHLYLSGHTHMESGKEAEELEFVAGMQSALLPPRDVPMSDPSQVLESAWRASHLPPYQAEERAVLLPLVENYILSATHLNDFLDLRYAGPQRFLESHILRFPQPQSLSQAYGTAVHNAVRRLFRQFRLDGVLPSVEFLLSAYQQELRSQRLRAMDFDQLLSRGQDELQLYYVAESNDFSESDIVELDFRQQHVVVGEAQLTGKIDRLIIQPSGYVHVHDLKTGKPAVSWKGKSADETYSLEAYRRQLFFYKLLVEHSRDYAGKWRVASGQLDFLKPLAGGFVSLPLDGYDEAEMDTIKALIEVVYRHVKEVNFPDTSAYSPDVKGSKQFEQDLLEGKI